MRDASPVPDSLKKMREAVFGFDYMGAAEFEFGAVPKCLREMVKTSDEMVSSTIVIPKKEIGAGWGRKPAVKDGLVYLLARPEHAEHAEKVIRAEARDDYSVRLKEHTCLCTVLNPRDDDAPNFAGWLEMDNGFWFFTDEKMRDGVCALLGLEP